MGFAEASKVPEGIDSGIPRGKLYHIACMTWFTASGKPQPIRIKFEGDDGSLQTVRDIVVRSVEEKNYSGIPSKEYDCEAIVGGLIREFKLIFYCDVCKWVMVI